MKKKYNLKAFLSGILMTTCLMACDPLGIEPTTVVDEDRFWQDAQLTRSYVNQFYLYAPATANHKHQSEQWSDNAIGWLDGQYADYRQTNFAQRNYDAANPTTDCFNWNSVWNNLYKNVRSANLGLERISTSSVLKDQDRKQMLGECYFFRALFYFELEQYWGAVPYVDKVLSVFDETMIPRSTREEIFDHILADLDQAISLFNESSNTPAIGMVNANVVAAIKSRIALYAGCAAEASSKGIYGNDASGKLFTFTKPASEYYRQALTAASSVIGKYSLEPEYRDLFESNESYKSKESIWPVMFNKGYRDSFNPSALIGPLGLYYGTGDKSWGRWYGVFPTEDLVECYYQKDEADGKWKQWWKTQQAQKGLQGTITTDGIFKGSGDDYRDLIYANRDKRLYATIAYDGSYLSKEDNQKEMYIIQTWIDDQVEVGKEMVNSALHTGYRGTADLKNPTGRTNSITGYYVRKYGQFNAFNDDGTIDGVQRSTCYFMIRYAEVLLNYAEAAIKLGEGNAETYINEIRNRAGLDNFDANVVGHDLWEEYKLQRRAEFAFEVPGQRYYDLLRWSEAEGKSIINELNGSPKTMRLFRKGIETTEPKEQGYPVEKGGEGYFTPRVETVRLTYPEYRKKFDHARYYFVPFGESMLQNYNGLVQNPGWTNFNYK